MEQQKAFELDGVEYVMTPANAMSSWVALKNALKLAEGFQLDFSSGDKQKIGLNVLQNLLANLGDPSVQALEEIVLKHTVCKSEGKSYRLSDNPDRHFNQYRGHLIPILIEGVKYQFADFFSGGGGLLKTMLMGNLQASQ